jgi:hypothetical protein
VKDSRPRLHNGGRAPHVRKFAYKEFRKFLERAGIRRIRSRRGTPARLSSSRRAVAYPGSSWNARPLADCLTA